MTNLITREILQHVVLVGHQGLRSQTRKYGDEERLGLLDHREQVLIRQKNLVVRPSYKYLKKLVESVKRSLLHSFHESTPLVLLYTV